MANTPILRISDGDKTVSLLSEGATGIYLDTWRPAIAGAKSGGVFQSSSLSENSRLAVRMLANATEVINFKAGALTQNLTIQQLQDLIDLLEKAIDYSIGTVQQNPVYFEAKAACEDNSKFALIVFYQWQELDNPYAQPFFGISASQLALMDNLTLSLERQNWGNNAPGSSDCVLASGLQKWAYNTWNLSTASPVTDVNVLFETSTGRILAGEDGEVWHTDDGTTWIAATTPPANDVFGIVEVSNILYAATVTAGDGEIWISVDDGNIWTLDKLGIGGDSFNCMVLHTDGFTYLADTENDGAGVRRTNDGFVTATRVLDTLLNYDAVFSHSDGTIYTSGGITLSTTSIARSTNGTTWVLRSINPYRIFSFLELVNGDIIAGATNITSNEDVILLSSNNGDNWQQVQELGASGGSITALLSHSNGKFYACTGSQVWVSDDGIGWHIIIDISAVASDILSIVERTANDNIYLGETGNIFVNDPATVDMGRASTCTNEVFITNGQHIANLTHIKIDNGGVFSDIFPISSFPQALLPAVPVTNDAVYFGIEEELGGPFSGLVFDIATVIDDTDAYDATVWEYSDGAAGWPTLTIRDETDAIGLTFSQNGVGSIHWENPSDWAVEAIDGVTAFWVRMVVTIGNVASPPTQQNRDIYTINQPFINIASTVVNGEITALLQQKLQNRSDKDGRTFIATGTHTGANNVAVLTDAAAAFDTDGVNVGMIVKNTTDGSVAEITAFTATTITGTLAGGTDNDWDTNDTYEVLGLDLFENRVICGLRSVSRGLLFQSYLNISDEQNPDGITVTATGTNTGFFNDPTTPTGRKASFVTVGIEAMTTQVTIALGSTIAQHFYGKFHVFLRVQKVADGTLPTAAFNLQLQFVSGSGGIQETTQIKQAQTTTQWELLDFGVVSLPIGGQLKSTDLGDITEIRIQVAALTAGVDIDLNLYDLILIPVDEWAGDFVDFANNDNSIVGRNNDTSKLLDIDSVTNPKVDIQSFVRLVGTEQITSIYDSITPNKAILQSGAQQRLWFLATQTDQTGTLTAWIAPPEISHSVQMFMNERWLTMRGDS